MRKELADIYGHLITDPEAVSLEQFQCAECPRRLFPDVDALTERVNEVYELLALWPFLDVEAPMAFIYSMLGLKPNSPEGREIYRRLARRIALEREHHKLMHPDKQGDEG